MHFYLKKERILKVSTLITIQNCFIYCFLLCC